MEESQAGTFRSTAVKRIPDDDSTTLSNAGPRSRSRSNQVAYELSDCTQLREV